MSGKVKTLWSCKECGHTQLKWTGSCSACRKWNTFVEEVEESAVQGRFERISSGPAQPQRVTEIQSTPVTRASTQMVEWDRLLGGGIVVGSLFLVAGDPGIGKSTLLLQLSESLASQGLTVLYVSGEESLEQTSLRASRLGAKSDRLYLLSETYFSHIKNAALKLKPDVMIVDSIQILCKAELSSAPGSVSQVRELALEFMHLAKGNGMSVFLVGHVTKSGDIAGPRVLEHMVDVVLEFEGDQRQGYRLLRAVKNRFGPTDDIVLFQMGSAGLHEVRNPSLIFLEERSKELAGSVIIPTVEGSRALLIEVQALVAASAFATSTRKSTGLDPNRLSLLLAVLEKRMGYALHHNDVFVSVAGGLKISEPAIDLGVLLAITSSFCNKSLDGDTVVMGEVGLSGEVRSVTKVEQRVREATHMGFLRCVLPARTLKGLPPELSDKIELIGIESVEEAINLLLN